MPIDDDFKKALLQILIARGLELTVTDFVESYVTGLKLYSSLMKDVHERHQTEP